MNVVQIGNVICTIPRSPFVHLPWIDDSAFAFSPSKISGASYVEWRRGDGGNDPKNEVIPSLKSQDFSGSQIFVGSTPSCHFPQVGPSYLCSAPLPLHWLPVNRKEMLHSEYPSHVDQSKS
jgi:hypothetical protein